MTTIVTGFGRCGSSLTMQMLQAGGFPVVGEFPAFEHEHARLGSFNAEWLACQEGAVKVLDPHRLKFDESGEYQFVWLDRAAKQQAASQVKFMFLLSGAIPPNGAIRRVAESYRQDRPVALAALEELGPILRVTFEEILRDPHAAACRIASFVDREKRYQLNTLNMASVVIQRPPACRPDLKIEAYLIGRAELAKAAVNGKEPEA